MNKTRKYLKIVSLRHPNIVNYSIAFLFFLFLAIIHTGCAHKDTAVQYIMKYQEIKVPVKCQIERPERPVNSGDIVQNVANILQYTEQLEALIKKCE